MSRLHQTKRGQIGLVYKSKINNDIGLVSNYRNIRNKKQDIKVNEPSEEMKGDGFVDIFKKTYEKGKQGVKYLYDNRQKISDAYTGEIGTALRNIIPASDETARPGFSGEKHTILQLPNGKYGVANYMGPQTALSQRLSRNDPPRTEVDKASMAHDIRYSLAKTPDDIRKADNLMMNAVDRIARNRGDTPANIAQARLIKAKVIGEDLGLIKKEAFSGDLSKNIVSDSDRVLFNNKLSSLEQEGYGKKKLLPADVLKIKLLKQMAKEKKMKGKGASVSRDLGSPYKLSGNDGISGSGGIMDLVISRILPDLMKKVGIPEGLISPSQLKNIISRSVELVKNGNVSSIIEHLSKTILPILTSLKSKSMGGSGSIVKRQKFTKNKLIGLLNSGLHKSFKHYIKNKNKGSHNIRGGAWNWNAFANGFLMPFRKIGEAIPVIGEPLKLLATELDKQIPEKDRYFK